MGLFNSIGKLFGSEQGMPQALPPVQPGTSFDEAFAPMQQQQPKRQDDGFLNIDPKLALLSQIFANMQGKDSPVWQAAQQAQMMRAQQMRDQQQRMAGREDKQWEWQNKPKEPPSDSFLRAMEAAGLQPGTPQYIEMARKRAQMLTNPVQLVPDGMGGMTPVRPQEMVNAPPNGILGAELPPGWTIEGDGGGNATGGFR